MTASALVQTRIDPELKEQAATVLEKMGLTISDAMRILLTRIANEGALPSGLTTDPVAHDAWFRARVKEALEDDRPLASDEEVDAHFAKRRAAASSKTRKDST